MMKRVSSILIALLIISYAYCENNRTVESLMHYAGNIYQFSSIVPQEKVYVQFDNTCYYSGEMLWFKAYVVNASNLHRAPSSVLYVELLSPSGVLLKHEKLKIVAGQADGSFSLVDGSTEDAREKRGVLGYSSGFYEIRAYTNNMLNFSEEAIFSRVFPVYDKPKEEKAMFTQNPVTAKEERTYVEQYRPKPDKPNNLNVSFFPEGGQALTGVPCTVAFKVTDDTGLGVDAEGVLNDDGTAFSTVHSGMGSFTYTPSDKSSSVTITYGDTRKTFTLPTPKKSGYNFRVKSAKIDEMTVEVYRSELLPEDTLGLSLTCRGELVAFDTISVGKSALERTISLTDVPEGVCRLTLFNQSGQVLAVRSLYHRGDILAPSITFTTDKSSYEPFEKMNMSFKLTDSKGQPFRDRFCLSVRDVAGVANAYSDDMRTYLLLSSDLKGLIEHPEYYFESRDDAHTKALDLLMLVQGWERYDWSVMSGVTPYLEEHRMEKGLTLNGWILNPSGRKKLEDVSVTAAVMPSDRTKTELFEHKTDSSGYFGFDLTNEFYDESRLTIRANTKKERLIGTSARIRFERSAKPEVRSFHPGETVFESIEAIREAMKGDDETEEEYSAKIIKDKEGYILPDVDIKANRKYVDYYTFKSFDAKKDVEIQLDKGDYTTDLYGYLLEKGYQVDASDIDGFEALYYVHTDKRYLYTGWFEIPTSIDMMLIESVNVYDERVTLSECLDLAPLYLSYLLSTGSYPEMEELYKYRRLVDVKIKENYQVISRKDIMKIGSRISTIEGYSRPYYFYNPTYPNGPVPGDVDYRRTLYWDPNVVTDSIGEAKVNFYNNSESSGFNVTATGITASGLPYILNQDF